jgi:uncharacterized membrane protein (Fun14 family)
VDVDWSSVFPHVEQLGFGAVAGFVVGYALKKVGKVVAVILGLLFVAIQGLAYGGFLTVHWGEVQARVDPLLGSESISTFWERLLDVLTFNLAFAGAFVPALLLGLRRG